MLGALADARMHSGRAPGTSAEATLRSLRNLDQDKTAQLVRFSQAVMPFLSLHSPKPPQEMDILL